MTEEELTAFNNDKTKQDRYLLVFTTICPHLGCSVNLDGTGSAFLCPCHTASFAPDGTRTGDSNPAPRDMDTLEWEIDLSDREFNRIKVKYQNFVSSQAEKKLA
jgi:Rieske Fe-S protein